MRGRLAPKGFYVKLPTSLSIFKRTSAPSPRPRRPVDSDRLPPTRLLPLPEVERQLGRGLIAECRVGRLARASQRRCVGWDAQVREDAAYRLALDDYGDDAQPPVALRAFENVY
jgi:hypothetical protein